ncbi:hypothetical protein KR038_008646 [Drosophila bunnanda]|nr:hypothetical protein KR038_008646 [Drosophila bunnanda]
MSGVFLQCRRTLVILRQNTAVIHQKGIFSKILDNYHNYRNNVKNEVAKKEEPKSS